MLPLIILLLGAILVVVAVVTTRRRTERTARARPEKDPLAPEPLMDRCLARIHHLESRRRGVETMIHEAEKLKFRLAGSEVHRSRIPLMERSLRLLHHQASLIDELLGRYYRQHHELELTLEAEHFQQRLEGIAEGYGDELLGLREEIDHLDGEYEQLILETEAQVEVENLLRRG